jgi:two-component system phosphate regulon sensor histidine kinase PhoR
MVTKDSQIKELIKVNDDLENYFRNTIIPQLFVDANLVLRKFTPPAMKHFSLTMDDVGRSILDIKENFRFPTIIDNIQQVIDCNEILEKEIQTTDFRWYQMNIIPYVLAKNNKTNGVIITFIEITMRIKDLKEQERLITDHEILLDTISHDIKTPLTSLLLSVEVLKKIDTGKSEKSSSLFNTVETGIKKMQQVITELSDARKQQFKDKADEELLNIEHILEDVRLTLSSVISDSGAVIKTEINISELTFSRRKLRSVVYNLVNNAIKFQPAGSKPEILITTRLEKKFIVLSVKDNGIGISSENQKSVFLKYFRAKNTIDGTGIGLFLVKEIVTNAGGKIVLKSKPGKGSEFSIFIKA